ncbi:hypothetical protein [uncultured Dokdonia sp.]|uniref:hypothetical protein n=1 Tax=uncultured Dokdonia sp. TaxID=575653 RepID=UPI00260CE417|nr:hypothetical protein [uncultured Dokdonia sp.]
MKKSKKALELNKLVISKLVTNPAYIMGGTDNSCNTCETLKSKNPFDGQQCPGLSSNCFTHDKNCPSAGNQEGC